MVFAALLGTGVVSQAFSVASALPNWIYELFLGGIFYSIFIPILIERITNHGEEDAQALTNALFTVALPLLAVVAVSRRCFRRAAGEPRHGLEER